MWNLITISKYYVGLMAGSVLMFNRGCNNLSVYPLILTTEMIEANADRFLLRSKLPTPR